jgi:hypothetical protein
MGFLYGFNKKNSDQCMAACMEPWTTAALFSLASLETGPGPPIMTSKTVLPCQLYHIKLDFASSTLCKRSIIIFFFEKKTQTQHYSPLIGERILTL